MNIKLLLAGVAAGALQAPCSRRTPSPAARARGRSGASPNERRAERRRRRRRGSADAIRRGGRRGDRRHRPKPRGAVVGDIAPELQLDRRDIRALRRRKHRPNCSTRSRRRPAAAADASGGSADHPAQRPANLRLLGDPRHPARGDRAGRHPSRGSRSQIWLSRRPEGGEHRPSAPLPGGHRRRPRRSRHGRRHGLPTAPTPTCSGSTRPARNSLDAEYQHADRLVRERARHHPGDSDRRRSRRFPDPALGDRPAHAQRHDQPPVLGDVSATLNARFDANSSLSFLGRRGTAADRPLTRESQPLAGHLGLALNGAIWRHGAGRGPPITTAAHRHRRPRPRSGATAPRA